MINPDELRKESKKEHFEAERDGFVEFAEELKKTADLAMHQFDKHIASLKTVTYEEYISEDRANKSDWAEETFDLLDAAIGDEERIHGLFEVAEGESVPETQAVFLCVSIIIMYYNAFMPSGMLRGITDVLAPKRSSFVSDLIKKMKDSSDKSTVVTNLTPDKLKDLNLPDELKDIISESLLNQKDDCDCENCRRRRGEIE